MQLSVFQFGGHPIYYREGTSDSAIIHVTFLSGHREYQFPEIKPRIVLDIGANIGVVSILLARLYPESIIHAFEPQADNFAILEQNTKPYKNVHRHKYGLGKRTAKVGLYASDDATNFGGYSLFSPGSNTAMQEQVEIVEVNEAMRWLGVTAADVIKIDCEGAEYDILMGMEILANSGWICGELHGNRDYELLGFLSHGFDLAIQKKLGARCFHFTARRKPG